MLGGSRHHEILERALSISSHGAAMAAMASYMVNIHHSSPGTPLPPPQRRRETRYDYFLMVRDVFMRNEQRE